MCLTEETHVHVTESMSKEGAVAEGRRCCPLCGRVFVCGMEAGQKKCWCTELPPVSLPAAPAAGCVCPACLRKMPVKTAFSD